MQLSTKGPRLLNVQPGCRDRQRQLLQLLDSAGALSLDALRLAIDRTECPEGHPLRLGDLDPLHLRSDVDRSITLTTAGDDWLLEADRPPRPWHTHVTPGHPPLRQWQVESLDSWSRHGRHGVIEAVTGTGKSRVGVEAAREAIDDDYDVIVMVPTIDLVEQWVKTLRHHGLPRVGALGDGQRATLHTHRVLVGTVQSLYQHPPTRSDGKVLMVADECHRYGSGQWRQALHPSYRRRLGLTATFERNDDGLGALLSYFGGPPVFCIGFPRAIRDGAVAHYDVKLLGVPLSARERSDYEEADKTARDARIQLLVAGFAAEPFGTFLHEVQRAADGDEDPTVGDVARRYLKAFATRIDVMTNAEAKLDVAQRLAPQINSSNGAILFTRRVDMAEDISETLVEAGVKAAPIHSDLGRAERKDRLAALRAGRLKAVVAPTVLDEGIDVPDIDLAVVMGGSRSRRQMIQRMGRVLRLKPDGGSATFIVVYALNTSEDLGVSDGSESCLDLIVESADSVTPLALDEDRIVPSDLVVRRAAEVADTFHIDDVVPASHPLMPRAVRSYCTSHGVDEDAATDSLRRMLQDLLLIGRVHEQRSKPGSFLLSSSGFDLAVSNVGVIDYRSTRPDATTWDDLVDETDETGETNERQDDSGDVEAVVARLPEPPSPSPTAPEVQVQAPPAVGNSSASPLVDQLERLASLRRDGFLTDIEFAAAKARLLY